jgi:ABC-type multidrug transport system permease subunit
MESVEEAQRTPKRTMLVLVCGLIAGICTLIVVACGVLYLMGEIDRNVFSIIFIVLAMPASVLGYIAIAAADSYQDQK